MKLCLFFTGSLYARVKIEMFQGENHVQKKFWKFTHPCFGGDADGRAGDPTSSTAASSSPGGLSAMQSGSIINL